jgi:glycine rich protein
VRRLVRLVVGSIGAMALVTAGVVATTPSVGAVPSCTGTTTVVCTFAFTGFLGDSFTVPAEVTQISIDGFGAQGGPSQDGTLGGRGGEATAMITVTPGEVLQVNVGGQPGTIPSGGPVPGGINGGGASGTGSSAGGGGGGASDVRQGGHSNGDRVVIAGGGGGGGGTVGSCTGGTGGGPNGGDGSTCSTLQGLGGTPSTGGGIGGGANPGSTGILGMGGAGGSSAQGFAGGGGGGGRFGGGGGSATGVVSVAGGGGGGSGLTPTSTGMTNGVRTGNGLITITYTLPPPVLLVGPRFTG